jgi:hypothetical protein
MNLEGSPSTVHCELTWLAFVYPNLRTAEYIGSIGASGEESKS